MTSSDIQTILRFISTDRLEVVLDAGCPDGALLSAQPEDCAMVALGTDLELLKQLRSGGPARFPVCGTLASPPFKAGVFDAVVVRHFGDDGAATQEMVNSLTSTLRSHGDLVIEFNNAWHLAGPRSNATRLTWPLVSRWMRRAGCNRTRVTGIGTGNGRTLRILAGCKSRIVVRGTRGAPELELGLMARATRRGIHFVKSSRLNNQAAQAEVVREARAVQGAPHASVDHLSEALAWLARAHDATDRRGVSRGYAVGWMPYFNLKGWEAAYPETTGPIIATFFELASVTGREECRQRAIELADWEAEIQLANGAVMAGTVGHEPTASVFSTGQVMFGWIRALEETGNPLYLGALERASKFLLQSQESDGAFRTGVSPVSVRRSSADHTRVAWALAAFGRLSGRTEYLDAGVRHLRYALRLQRANGWFDRCAPNDRKAPFTESICFAVEGLLGGYTFEKDERLLNAAMLATDKLVGCIGMDGRLPARLDADWNQTVSWDCLPGSAQLSALLLRLDSLTPNPRYRDAGLKLLQFLKLTQNCDSSDPGLRGGIKGAYPFSGSYGRYQLLNYSTRAFVDALLLERRLLTRV